MTPHFRDIQHCRFWMASHLIDGDGFACALHELAEAIDVERFRSRSPEALFQMVEVIRCAISSPARRLVDRAAGRLELLDAQAGAELLALDTAMDRLRLAAMAADSSSAGVNDNNEMHQSMPGTRSSKADVLPLARALQIQSMRIVAMLRTRTVVPDALWHELGDLAVAMRQSTFIDEVLGAENDPDGNRTARAWFVLPMLLRIAALEERLPAQAELVNRLAGYWAERVGFRIDPIGNIRTNKYGPSIKLGIEYRVRLDTHRLRDSMVRRQTKWLNPQSDADELPMGLTRVQLADLLEDLFIRWSPAWRSPKIRQAPGGAVRMRFGLPSRELVLSGRAVIGRNRSTYDYGQFQQEAVIGPARPSDVEQGTGIHVLRGADRGQWTFVDRQGVVVDRHATGSAPTLSGIVAFAVESNDRANAVVGLSLPVNADPDADPVQRGLRLGRIRAVQRLSGSLEGELHRVAMETFAGVPMLVEIEDGAGNLATGAYLLSSKTDHGQASLFVPLSRVTTGAKLLLRRPDDQVSVEVGSLVQRGPDYEQYLVKARGSATL